MNAVIHERELFPENNGQQMVLKKSNVKVSIIAPVAETQISHYFENKGQKPIEAVYTFPVPLDAVLLDVRVKLNGKIIHGQVQKKAEALEGYESAISQGDTTVLLEKIEEGLFTLNLGNLLPGQGAEITSVYSQTLQWTDTEIRYVLPTVIAPRYGYAMLEPQQAPDYDFRAEYPLHFEMIIEGALSQTEILSPSHSMSVRRNKQSVSINLRNNAFLDRDLVVQFISDEALPGFALTEQDGEQYAVLASFMPGIPEQADVLKQPRNLNILVDCSGSMSGDAIEQAKRALLHILDELQEGDHFSVLRFGSSVEDMSHGFLTASRENIVRLRRRIRHMQADMGGTEIFTALQKVYDQSERIAEQDVLLLTDGEVWENGELTTISRKFNRAGIRVFSVGIGSSVSEKLVRVLAQETQGACEFVIPGEDMASQIHRQFKRIYKPAFTQYEINWRQDVIWQSPLPTLFPGDSYMVYALLKDKPQSALTLRAKTDTGISIEEQLCYETENEQENQQKQFGTLTRMVINKKLNQTQNPEERAELAVHYQLMDDTTAFLMVEENQTNDGSEIPQLHKVPQMVAAGYAGSSVMPDTSNLMCVDIPEFLRRSALAQINSRIPESDIDYCFDDDFDDSLGMLDFSDEDVSEFSESHLNETTEFTKYLQAIAKQNPDDLKHLTLKALQQYRLPLLIADDLADCLKYSDDKEEELLLWFIYQLTLRFLGHKNNLVGLLAKYSQNIAISSESRGMILEMVQAIED